ncbi:uncharacterized protein ENSP00000383407 [Trichechus inunguis]
MGLNQSVAKPYCAVTSCETGVAEGSMDSLYEPVSEQQANQESRLGRTSSPFSPFGESGQAPRNLSKSCGMLCSWILPSFSLKNIPEGKTVNDTIWREPSKPENDSHIRRPCQLKDLNEDGFFLSNNIHTLQGKKLQGISCQVTSECCSPSQYHRHVKPTANEMVKNFSPDILFKCFFPSFTE